MVLIPLLPLTRSDTALITPSQQLPPALLQRILEFNLLPARYAHQSWLTDFDWLARHPELLTQTKVMRYLSMQILQQWDLQQKYWLDFNTPPTPVALLDRDKLLELVRYLGLALCHRYVQHSIERQRIQALKTSLGDAAYFFALRRAPLLGLAQLADVPAQTLTVEQFVQQADHTGLRCLATSLQQQQDPALQQRLLFKLPKQWAAQFQVDAAMLTHSIVTLPIRLLRELAPDEPIYPLITR